MEEIISLLHHGNYSCVVKNDTGIHTFSKPGVADLYNLLKNQPGFLKGASLADKVVGKGAATLAIAGGVQELYADILSEPALELLIEAGVKTRFGYIVPYIHNRDRSGWCPLEKLCYTENSVPDILNVIENFIQLMRNNQRNQSIVLTERK